jgi:hypothetical protein
MSFGRNPHVAKAETAEHKARTARDQIACQQAWRDAARQWERAADRETDDKRRTLYTEKAETARTNAEQPQAGGTLAYDSSPIAPARKSTPLN